MNRYLLIHLISLVNLGINVNSLMAGTKSTEPPILEDRFQTIMKATASTTGSPILGPINDQKHWEDAGCRLSASKIRVVDGVQHAEKISGDLISAENNGVFWVNIDGVDKGLKPVKVGLKESKDYPLVNYYAGEGYFLAFKYWISESERTILQHGTVYLSRGSEIAVIEVIGECGD